VPGNPIYFLRNQYTTSGTNPVLFETHLEDVTLFAGTTATYSFYAKISSGTKSVTPRAVQAFGSGGSSTVVTSYSAVTLTTTWTRFVVTMAIPSITGKTIGTSSFLRIDLIPADGSSGTLTYDFSRPQLEAGSVVTAFQTATGTIQGELAACQRYYQRVTGQFGYVATGTANNSTDVLFQMALPVQMRVAPTALSVSALADWLLIPGNKAISAITLAGPKPSIGSFFATSTGLSANQSWTLFPNGGTSGANTFIDFVAEL
jgi:hypothetical protein